MTHGQKNIRLTDEFREP